MPSQLLSPSVIAQSINANAPSSAWTSLAVNQGADTIFASFAGLSNAWTYYLKMTGFGFSLPGTDIVRGIKGEIRVTTNDATQFAGGWLALTLDGSTLATSAFAVLHGSGPASNRWFYKGQSNFLWGISPTAAQINSANFGLVYYSRSPNISPPTYEARQCHMTVWHQSLASAEIKSSSFILNLT